MVIQTSMLSFFITNLAAEILHCNIPCYNSRLEQIKFNK
jgi:hypothetical protein